MYTAGSKHPCPWCWTSLHNIDANVCDLTSKETMYRPQISDISSETTGIKWQRKATFSFLYLSGSVQIELIVSKR